MALRDFYPLSDFPPPPSEVSSQPDFSELESIELKNEKQLSKPAENLIPGNAEPLPSIGLLAVEMEKSRKELLSLLLETPEARQMLNELIADKSAEGVEFSICSSDDSTEDNIVQENDFVQVDLLDLSKSNRRAITDKACGPMNTDLSHIHFYPAFLIRVTEQMCTGTVENIQNCPAYKKKLQATCRHLKTIRQQLIVDNTGLVAFVAYKHKTTCLSFDDLMQEGIVGLIKAVDRFDPTRGIRFSTYAVFWIKQAISRLIIKQEKVVRLPVAMAEKASVVFEVMRACYLENNRWPTLVELQNQCSLCLEDIKTISSYYQATHSLDAAVSEENDDQTMMDTMVQQQFVLPLNELIDNNLSHYLGTVVASLPEKEAAILNMRFGLRNQTEMTLQAIADQLHITRERVRQIQNQALNKLKLQFGYDLLPFLEPNDN